MKKEISVKDLVVGENLGRDIFDAQGRLLLRRGTVLIADLKDGLLSKDIVTVFIEVENEITQEEKEGPTQVVTQNDNFVHFSRLYNTLLFEIERTALRGKYNKPLQSGFKDDIYLLIQYLLKNDDKNCLNHYFHLKKNAPDYTYKTHALNTAILSILIGKWLECDHNTIFELGLTGCFHDIGENRLPTGILNKKGKLTSDEWEIVKEHPVLGARVLNKTDWMPSRIVIGVLRHHERLDGTGYPQGCLGSDIPLHARVAAVASIFNAMTTNRSYAKSVDVLTTLDDLRNRSYGQLDAKVTRTLYEKIIAYLNPDS